MMFINFCSVAVVFIFVIKGSFSDQTRITSYAQILSKVENVLTPPPNASVAMELKLSHIHKLDEKNQVLYFKTSILMNWMDSSLKWNRGRGDKEYELVPAEKIWTPDITIWNSVNDNDHEGWLKSGKVYVYPDGSILWKIHSKLETHCTVDVTYYPYDQQTCILKFRSTDGSIPITLYRNRNNIDLSEYYLSVEWTVIECPAYVNQYTLNGGGSEHDITYYITIRRKTLFSTMTKVFPLLLVALVSIFAEIIPFHHLTPKIFMHLLSLGILLKQLFDAGAILPPTSLVIPLIFKFILGLGLINIVQILLTCILANCNRKHEQKDSNQGYSRKTRAFYCCFQLFTLTGVIIATLLSAWFFVSSNPHANEIADFEIKQARTLVNIPD